MRIGNYPRRISKKREIKLKDIDKGTKAYLILLVEGWLAVFYQTNIRKYRCKHRTNSEGAFYPISKCKSSQNTQKDDAIKRKIAESTIHG